jgi:signal transduction histidine kinase
MGIAEFAGSIISAGNIICFIAWVGYVELAMVDPPIEIKSFIDAMYRNAFRIQKLTKDILDVTRIESHTLRLNKIKFDLKECV